MPRRESVLVEDFNCARREQGQKSGQLFQEQLAKRGEIPLKLVDVVSNLREFRNVGAHATLGELSATDVPLLDDLAKAILEYVYSAPFLAKRAEDRLSQLTKRKKTGTATAAPKSTRTS